MINEIGIVGMSYRFSGGIVDCENYWKLLNKSCHVSTGIPCDWWDTDSLLAS